MSLLRHLAAAVAAVACTGAWAQTDASLAVPPRERIDAVLHLEGRRAETVESILAAAQARMIVVRSRVGASLDDTSRAALLTAILLIRYETDAQLATVLTPDEFARLKEAVHPASWVRALPSRGTPM